MTLDDVKVVNMEPGPAAQAFLAGQNDAAMTYEPYLSSVRAEPDKGKIIATTLDYPAVMDTFGCTPAFLKENPEAAKALADSYFEALEMIASDKDKSYEIMGADVKQSGEQFGKSAANTCEWQDKAANQKFFADDVQDVQRRGRRPAADDGRHQGEAGPVEPRRHVLHQVRSLAKAMRSRASATGGRPRSRIARMPDATPGTHERRRRGSCSALLFFVLFLAGWA